MSDQEQAIPLGAIDAPWGRKIELFHLDYPGGALAAVRVRIREGRRFTTLDLDAATARLLAQGLSEWADGQEKDGANRG